MKGFLSGSILELNRIEHRRQQLIEQGRQLLDLTQSNPTLAGYLFPKEVLTEASINYFSSRRYTPDPKGLLSSRESLASYLSSRFPTVEFSPHRLFLVASTSEAYRMLFSLLCNSGDKVLTATPSYPLIELISEEMHLETGYYSLECDSSSVSQSQFDTSEYEVVCITSPHNPTGVIHRSPIRWVIDSKLPIISDAVFMEHCWETPSPSLLELYSGQPVIELGGISKSFALPDLKLSWMALNPAAYDLLGSRLEFVADQYLSANQLTQSLLPSILEKGKDFLNDMRTSLRNKTLHAVRYLADSGKFTVRPPAGGPFIFAQTSARGDDEEFVLELLDSGIFVHPGHYYGYDGMCSISFSTVVSDDILGSGLMEIVQALN